jgi:flagellar hook assembly protein FlgD
VRLGVYDLQGRLVRTLAERVYAPGEHSVVWDGRDESGSEMPSGLYLYRLEDGRRTQTRKMVLVR